jgi:hypothetical protein
MTALEKLADDIIGRAKLSQQTVMATMDGSILIAVPQSTREQVLSKIRVTK